MLRQARQLTLLLSLAFTSINCFSSNPDSLKLALRKASVKEQLTIYAQLSIDYLYVNIDSSMHYTMEGLELAKQERSDIDLAHLYINLGNIYLEKGENDKALINYIESEKFYQKVKNSSGIINSSINIGIVYERQGLYEKALSQYNLASTLSQETDNNEGYATSLNNIGSLYYSMNEKNKALEYFSKSLKINRKINNVARIMEGLNNVAILYQELGKFEEALQNYKVFLEYSQKLNDKKSIMIALHNIGLVYKDKKAFEDAIYYIQKSIDLANEVNDFSILEEACSSLSEIYTEKQDFSKALELFRLAAQAKDSLLSQTKQSQLLEMSTRYETEKKESENKILKTQGEKQRAISFAVTVGLVLVLALAFFVYSGYRQKKKANALLEVQNTEIREKKNIIEEKQKEILDSITYAKRLQQAILPPLNSFQQMLPDSFIYYQPKDIVAGDFYWMETLMVSESDSKNYNQGQKNNHNKITFIAAADCTGHGVPGAMVSVICSNALNRAVLEFNLTEPGTILDKAREIVLETFAKSDTEVKDGMDISLAAIYSEPHSVKPIIKWAGANRPLLYVQNNEIKEITPNKQPIGKTEQPAPFETHTVELEKGDSIYLFTDGYADQFGGPKGKKFKLKQLKELLLKNASLSTSDQSTALSTSFNNWKGTLEQLDDVCVIGVRI